jgi:ribosomal protein S1
MKGARSDIKIIECEPASERIVSIRASCSVQAKANARLYLSRCALGFQTQGLVTNVTDFGVFVDLGGVEGLVHVSELSWGSRSNNQRTCFKSVNRWMS